MKVGALQTAYLPWLGFFDQIYQCDLFIIYDDLQYTKRDWRNRNRIKTSQGPIFLSVPVNTKNAYKKIICNMEIAWQNNWALRHWRALKMNYSRAIFFNDLNNFFRDLYKHHWKYLAPLNRHIIDTCLNWLNIKTPVIYSSEAEIEKDYLLWCKGKTDATERIVYLCKRFGARQFLEGSAGKNYIKENILKEAGILLEYHNYPHPVYRQQFGDFIPYLSIVDLLFNHGNESLSILTHSTSDKATDESR